MLRKEPISIAKKHAFWSNILRQVLWFKTSLLWFVFFADSLLTYPNCMLECRRPTERTNYHWWFSHYANEWLTPTPEYETDASFFGGRYRFSAMHIYNGESYQSNVFNGEKPNIQTRIVNLKIPSELQKIFRMVFFMIVNPLALPVEKKL